MSNSVRLNVKITQRDMIAAPLFAMDLCSVMLSAVGAAEQPPTNLSFETQADVAFKELSPDFCWFHPRVASIPGYGKDGQPAMIMTILKHLAADDHFSGPFFMRTDDLGKTWFGPTEFPELAWRKGTDGVTVAVNDPTPGWHSSSGKLLDV